MFPAKHFCSPHATEQYSGQITTQTAACSAGDLPQNTQNNPCNAAPSPGAYSHEDNTAIREHNFTPEIKTSDFCASWEDTDSAGSGLFYYQKWWKYEKVDISVNGELLTGTPIFTEADTLRVVNDQHSYFIPVKNIDYIRTPDGLEACSESFK